MATLNGDARLSDCEELSRIARFVPDDGRTLRVATNIGFSTRPLGGASLAQAIITWSRAYPDSRLVTYVPSTTDIEAASNFADTLHGFVATMMASEVLSNDGQINLKPLIYPLIRDRTKLMNDRDLGATQKGIAASLICVDHSSLSFLEPLYYSPHIEKPLRGEDEYIDLLTDLLDRSVAQKYRSQIGQETAVTLGSMLRELFANTHEHARTDFEGRPWKRSVRGISLRFHYVDSNKTAEFSSGLPALRKYFDDHKNHWADSPNTMTFVELSIFDSGPGLASRFLRRPIGKITAAEEMEAVRNCFLKHVSSKLHPNAGVGLSRTMALLKGCNGFLRMRTGNLSLYKSYLPSKVGHFKEELRGSDTTLEAATIDGISQIRPVSGTLVSVLIPVGHTL